MRCSLALSLALISLIAFGADNPRLGVPKVYVSADLTDQSNTADEVALVKRAAAALDLELVNKIEETRLYQIMGENDLERAVKSLTKGRSFDSNLADPKFVSDIRDAGLKYILVLSLEDADDENVQLGTKQGKTATLRAGAVQQKQDTFVVSKGRKARHRKRGVAVAAVGTKATIGQTVSEQMQLFVSVRCKIFEASSGALLDASSHEFTAARVADRLNDNQKGEIPDDFFRTAARDSATWAVSRLLETTFPARIVAIDSNMVTISRGHGAQIKSGQVYVVKSPGKELKDPSTGAVLGREELTVGRVRIMESDSKFAKARVVEDKGIAMGSVLRASQD